jgi:hypothetical protein
MEELDNIIPVNPPTVNKNKNPINQSKFTDTFIKLPNIEAIQLKTLIPVGSAITIVAEVK